MAIFDQISASISPLKRLYEICGHFRESSKMCEKLDVKLKRPRVVINRFTDQIHHLKLWKNFSEYPYLSYYLFQEKSIFFNTKIIFGYAASRRKYEKIKPIYIFSYSRRHTEPLGLIHNFIVEATTWYKILKTNIAMNTVLNKFVVKYQGVIAQATPYYRAPYKATKIGLTIAVTKHWTYIQHSRRVKMCNRSPIGDTMRRSLSMPSVQTVN